MLRISAILIREIIDIFKRRFIIIKILIKNKGCRISFRTKFLVSDYHNIIIGNKTSINDFTVVVVNDCLHKDSKFKDSSLEIGKSTYIGEHNNLRAGGGTIKIGNNCLISQNVTIVASNHSIERNKLISEQPWSEVNNFVIIEDDVWIGANSVILPGVTIGRGTVVGSGSVVTKNVASYSVVAGNPAKIIKSR